MHEFKRFIQQQLDARGWKQADLVRASGLSRSHVSKLMRDNREHLGQMPEADTIAGLARGFSLPEETVRTAASRALVGYEDDGHPIQFDLTEVSTDALLQEVRRRIEEKGTSDASDTEEVSKPRPQEGGPEHSSTSGGDRPRRSSSMKRTITRIGTGKADALNHEEQDHGLDHAELSHFPEFEGDMPDPSTLSPEEIWAARTTDDMSGMKPEGESDDTA